MSRREDGRAWRRGLLRLLLAAPLLLPFEGRASAADDARPSPGERTAPGERAPDRRAERAASPERVAPGEKPPLPDRLAPGAQASPSERIAAEDWPGPGFSPRDKQPAGERAPSGPRPAPGERPGERPPDKSDPPLPQGSRALQPGSESIESSVVRVLVYSNPPDFFSPWQRIGTQASSGSGVIIEGNRILTNAHVVADAVGIEVKRAGSGEQFEAEVSFIGHDCDLALLTVSDRHFFDGAKPLSLGDLPGVNEHVQTYGFPVGGETLSVTSGVISRVEVGTYSHSKERMLIAQIDAPINPGNSGGPVVRDGAIVGISMQMLEQAENVGYMVPAPVVRHFLDDVADAKYDGVPQLGVRLQPLESPALRASLGLGARQSGALVTRVDFGSPASGMLERGDVIVSVGGYPVAGDLTVAMPGNGRVSLEAVVGAQQVGARLKMKLLRGAAEREIEMTLTRSVPLVPGRRVGEEPEYFVFGGAVFQPLTGEYFELYEHPPANLATWADARNAVTEHRRQVVMLSTVLPGPVGRGYLDWESVVVRSVDGVVPRDLAHLAELIDRATGTFLRIESDDGFVMMLDVAAAREAAPRILAKYGIPFDRSANLRAGQQPVAGAAASTGGASAQ